MQFRLVYQGKLPSQQGYSKVKEKHEIRRALHKQLRELWETNPFLRERKRTLITSFIPPDSKPSITGSHLIDQRSNTPPKRPILDWIADSHAALGYRFVPLVSSLDGVACAVDILFLRRDEPGSLIKSGGDIDNRIKVLFDAMRIPQASEELKGTHPEQDEDPFFCLLEDDRLITEVKVTTDKLLAPRIFGEHVNDVHLVIHVRTLVLEAREGNRAFLT